MLKAIFEDLSVDTDEKMILYRAEGEGCTNCDEKVLG